LNFIFVTFLSVPGRAATTLAEEKVLSVPSRLTEHLRGSVYPLNPFVAALAFSAAKSNPTQHHTHQCQHYLALHCVVGGYILPAALNTFSAVSVVHHPSIAQRYPEGSKCI